MRFIKLFSLMLLVALVGGGLVWLGLTEGRIWWAGRQLRSDFYYLKRLYASEAKGYRDKCREQLEQWSSPVPYPPEAESEPLLGFQLRFLNNQTYVIEAVCRADRKAIGLKTVNLIRGVIKVSGSGARLELPLIPDKTDELETGLVVLEGQLGQYLVGINQGRVVKYRLKPGEVIAEGDQAAVTTCEGWGRQCCDPIIQVGQGENQPKVSDCPNDCYAACAHRPQVVFFNTDPVINMETRQVEVAGSPFVMTFGYEVTDPDSPIAAVTINYGDGSEEKLANKDGIISHEYYCGQTECVFEANLSVVDNQGLEIPDLRVAKITVVQRT